MFRPDTLISVFFLYARLSYIVVRLDRPSVNYKKTVDIILTLVKKKLQATVIDLSR